MNAVISVSDYLNLANHALRSIPSENMVVEGEVADFKVSQGKWVNFDLKDEHADAKIPCFMTVYALAVPLANGMRIQVSGQSKVFERFGKFTFNVSEITLVGEGALQKAYVELKAKLEREGLFDRGRKRSIPQFPGRIGLITSSEAAAYGDFLRILNNRWHGVTVLHTPVHVQGQFAVPDILHAFAQLNELPEFERPEVIVLTRGGGSLEDLHAFNSEAVARAVFQSAVPVVVGVGHERDESLCDFVADVRASTPSNAAELVVPDARSITSSMRMSVDRMMDQLQFGIDRRVHLVDRSVNILDRSMAKITESIENTTRRFSYAFERFRLSIVATLARVGDLERILRSMDPHEVLRRGYAIVRSGTKIIRRANDVAPGDRLAVQFGEGSVLVVAEGNARQESLL